MEHLLIGEVCLSSDSICFAIIQVRQSWAMYITKEAWTRNGNFGCAEGIFSTNSTKSGWWGAVGE